MFHLESARAGEGGGGAKAHSPFLSYSTVVMYLFNMKTCGVIEREEDWDITRNRGGYL